MNQLILLRALQGLGAGMGIALVATVCDDLFEPAARAKWGSAFGIVYGVSNLFGPTLGGWLTEHGPLMGSLITRTESCCITSPRRRRRGKCWLERSNTAL